MRQAIFLLLAATLQAAESSPTFERDILPIFTANCFNCHSGGSLIGLDLRTAEATLQGSHQGPVVIKGSPEKSPLFQKVSSRTMPPPAFKLKLTDAQIETVRKWIADGAPHEETKNGSLQAATVQFDKAVKPILATRCTGCHGAGKPMAGLDLRTLASVLDGSKNGPVVVEGAADKSPLLRRTLSGSMPPKGRRDAFEWDGDGNAPPVDRHVALWQRGYSHSVARAVLRGRSSGDYGEGPIVLGVSETSEAGPTCAEE
jgi:mono/diheme cytochrome c family protein